MLYSSKTKQTHVVLYIPNKRLLKFAVLPSEDGIECRSPMRYVRCALVVSGIRLVGRLKNCFGIGLVGRWSAMNEDYFARCVHCDVMLCICLMLDLR